MSDKPSTAKHINPAWAFRTRAIHVGQATDAATGAVVPPIYLASTYVQDVAGEWGPFDYSRSGNPTRQSCEQVVANLEGGQYGLAYASGVAAIHGVLMLLRAGDHVVAGTDIYGGTYRLLHQILPRADISVTLAPTTDLAAVSATITDRTRLVWLETPGNPLLSVTDIAAVADIAHSAGVPFVAVDNTFATPVLTRPLELGADIVMHSATKYFGGHSDLTGGLLAVKEESLYRQLYFALNATGCILAPFDSYLVSRGAKTLELRVREHCRSAAAIAEYLAQHPAVERVYYPGLASHPGHAIAVQQMQGGFGAMMSFTLKANLEQTKRFVASRRLFRLAVSLGAVESLIAQPALMSHASYAPAQRQAHGITDNLIRLSVGLEAPADLIADLEGGLADL